MLEGSRSRIWSGVFQLPSGVRPRRGRLRGRSQAVEAARDQRPVVSRLARSHSRATAAGSRATTRARGERIYHLPGMPYYSQTVAEEISARNARLAPRATAGPGLISIGGRRSGKDYRQHAGPEPPLRVTRARWRKPRRSAAPPLSGDGTGRLRQPASARRSRATETYHAPLCGKGQTSQRCCCAKKRASEPSGASRRTA